MLGHKMFQILSAEFKNDVYATLRKDKTEILKFEFMPRTNYIENIDVENNSAVLSVLNQIKPQFIINCAGVTLRKLDNSSIEKNYNINSYLPKFLAAWAVNNQSKLIHFSTDCVFDGGKGDYAESDLATAQDVYGRSKYLGEVLDSNSLILRLSIVGRELFNKSELLEWFLSQNHQKISGYSNVYYTGLTTNFVANEVIRIIRNYPQISGLYQLASEKISKFDLLMLANQIYNNQSVIVDDKSKKSDKSLNCEKYIKKTNFKKPNWPEMLLALKTESELYEN